MKKKTLGIFSSIAVIACCACLAVGATFALFTSQSEVNIAVTSGKVNVVAVPSDLTLYSAAADVSGTLVDENGNTYSYVKQSGNSFANGGIAALNGNALTIERITPGDKAEFNIQITNNSNVAIKYRTIVAAEDAALNALEITINGETYGQTTNISNWTTLAVNETIGTYTVSVALPLQATDTYQDLSAVLNFTVEAVQANATTADPDPDITYLYNASDLLYFAQQVNSGSTAYRNQTIQLMNDIDLSGILWEPINGWKQSLDGLVLDGQGHTIRNMTIQNGTSNSGFIGSNSSDLTIRNLRFEGVDFQTQGNFIGTVIGYQYGEVTLENVHVSNGVIDNRDCIGIRVGGLIGFSVLHDGAKLHLQNCSVSDFELYGYHNICGLVGTLYGYNTLPDRWSMTDCSVKNVTIYREQSNLNYSSAFSVNGGENGYLVYTENEENFTSIGNTAENVRILYTSPEGLTQDLITGETLISSADDLTAFAASVNAGNSYKEQTVVLTQNIDLAGLSWEPIGQEGAPFQGTFDGRDYTVSNLTCDLPDRAFVGLFGVLNSPAVIENLTIENATVTGKESVGAIAGGYTGTIQNCTVQGDIFVTGNYKVGGLIGYAYVGVNDCQVIGNTGSFVKGIYREANLEGDNIGGAIGFTGEATGRVYSGISVCGIDVIGTRKVGGVIGYLNFGYTAGMTLQNVSFSDGTVKIEAPDDYLTENGSRSYVGGIVGEYSASYATYPILLDSAAVENAAIIGYAQEATDIFLGGTRGSYSDEILTLQNTTYLNVDLSYTNP